MDDATTPGPWSRFERRWLACLLGALIPAGGPGRGGLASVSLASFWELFEATAPPLLRIGLRTATWLFSLAPIAYVGRPCTFASLDPDARDRVLVGAAGSRIFLVRQLMDVLKFIACLAYFHDDGVRASVRGPAALEAALRPPASSCASRVDGREIATRHGLDVDVVVVGSGPAGAAVARVAARSGATVAVLEAGPWVEPAEFSEDSFGAMARHYQDLGVKVLLGATPMPFLQGRVVGGTSVVNGAICWRMPRPVHEQWVAADPALAEALPWQRLEQITDRIETDLEVAPTAASVAGPKNSLMARGAEALGLAHGPIRRNVRGCRGLGRCLQGCPQGHKLSMDRSFLLDAEVAGASILSSVEVDRILVDGNRAVGVEGRALGGGRVSARARRAVVLAASAIQTPALLLANGIRHGPVGRHLKGHPGVSVLGRFSEPVRAWEGATQGHEVTGLVSEGLKFETLGFGLAVLASRLEGVGLELARNLEDLSHWVSWGAAVRARGEGRVRLVGRRPVVSFRADALDLERFRRGTQVLGEMMLAAGAEHVLPGIHGWDRRVDDPRRLAELPGTAPRDHRAYTAAVTHLFGTCRMGSDPVRSVVRPDFRHHRLDRLYVADSSVFPDNTGVNPQIAILALATLCAEGVVE